MSTGAGIAGMVLLIAAIVMMARWFVADPQRRRSPALARDVYGHAWPLCGFLGIFLVSLNPVLDGRPALWQLALTTVWGAATIAATVAYFRFRTDRRVP